MPVHIGLAPAKLNLILRVLGRRADGYHDVATLMTPIDLFDIVRVRPAARFSCRCDGIDGENLALRAAKLLRVPARIDIDKRIPVAAGLAGGSSDAACVLRLLSPSARRDLASELGSDVPFFLEGVPAWATGRGTDLQAAHDLPSLFAALVVPPFRLRTAAMYEALSRGPTPGGRPPVPVLGRSFDRLCEHVANDFLPVAAERVPAVKGILQALLDTGARSASISGKGPACFGLFATQEEAQAASLRLRGALPSDFVVLAAGTGGPEAGFKPAP